VAGNQGVLVKLSAEGEEAVVAAFAKMAEGAKKHGKETEGSIGGIKEAALELGKTLAGLFAIEQVVHGFGELVKGAIETGEQLDRLHRQTGISTDSLQAYAFAARQAGVDGDVMTQAMGRLARAIFAAQQGSSGATTALATLGLHVRDFIGLTPDQQFQKVALALGTMEDHTKAQAAAQALMGRGAAQLLPVFQDVAEKGIGAYVARLKELGIYQSTELIAQFKQVQEEAKNLKAEAAGLATQFAAGLAPAVSHAMQTILNESNRGESGFKQLGADVGWLVDLTVTGFGVMGAAVGEFVAKTKLLQEQNWKTAFDAERFVDRMKGLGNLLTFGLFQKGPAEASGTSDALQRFRDLIAKGPSGYAPAATPTEGPPTGLGDVDAESARGQAIAKAKEQLQQQLLDNELVAFKDSAAKREAEEKESFETGKISLEKYFDDRAEIVNERAVEEIDVLVRKREATAAVHVDEDDKVRALEQQRELAKLDGQIAAINIQREKDQAALSAERFAAERKNTEAQEKAEEALAKLRGDHLAAQTAQLNRNLAELDRALAAGGVSQGGRDSALAAARSQGEAAIGFAAQAQQAKEKFADLGLELDRIKQAQASGEIFPVQAEQQTLETERARIPVLQQIVDEMTRLAQLSGNDALKEQAKQAQERIDALRVSTNTAGQELAKLKAVGQQTFTDGLSNALIETINNTKKAGDAFRQFGLQLAEALEQAIVKMLVLKAIQAVVGFAGGGSVGAGIKLASGGAVPGQGSGDVVPAMLTPGEFVVQKDAASQPGIRTLFEALNGGALRGKPTGGLQHFAAGGVVAAAASAAPRFRVVNVLDPTVLGDHLATAPGEQAVLNVMARHPNRIREALGS
jgi:hypothetical protein